MPRSGEVPSQTGGRIVLGVDFGTRPPTIVSLELTPAGTTDRGLRLHERPLYPPR